MSRIGRKPILVPKEVNVMIDNGIVRVKGPKGENHISLSSGIEVSYADGVLQVVSHEQDTKKGKALWGLHRALLANMITGVVQPFEKKLEMVGVGYKAAMQGQTLTLEVGFSHPVTIAIPQGVSCTVEKNTIMLASVDRQRVGQVAASIRAIRKPEPYKGKGIKYAGEIIRRKAGKAAKAAGAK